MKRWLRSKWTARGVALLVPLGGLLLAVWTPPHGHAVHSSGATQLTVSAYQIQLPQHTYYSCNCMPTAGESLASVECATWQTGTNRTCDPQDPSWKLYPTAPQTSHTLYLTWYGCIDWHGAGNIVPWEGFNFEYLPTSRSVVVHCYKAAPYLYFPERLYGVAALPLPVLYAIRDGSFGPGTVTVNEDDRLEHLVGDQTYDDFQLATTTIG